MTLMIALVGEQPQPNFLPVLYCPPNDVLLLYTQRTKPVYERLAATLQQKKTAGGKRITVHSLETDPYDIVAIAKALDAKLEIPKLAGKELLFNLTGGTKAMSFAAYQIAQQKQASVLYLQSEGRQNLIYRYTWNNQQLCLVSKDPVSEYVELRDLFDLQFGPGEWKEFGPDLNSDGGRFEFALAQALRPHKEYEVMAGVRGLNKQMEIDIVVRFQNQYGIIEAKLEGKGTRLDGIKQLVTAARQLGTYTQTFYAITVSPTTAHEEIRNAFRIQVISLLSYLPGTIQLSPDHEKTLIDTVDKALKG